MTDEEVDEVLHAAMTVGATRMQVMLSQEVAQLAPAEGTPSTPSPAATEDPRPSVAADRAGSPGFAAAEVVEQAGGG